MLHTVGSDHSIGALGVLLVSCAGLGAAYLWAVWMGALEFSAVLGPLTGSLTVAMR
jgi:hypothetical protein